MTGEKAQHSESENLVATLAIAGRLSKRERLARQVYYPHALLDGLSLSYSMFKYYCDVFIANQDFDLQHNILTSPEGIAAVAAESIFIIGFSFLAAYFKRNGSYALEKKIAAAWPYLRDIMKGIKNTYKGLRSTLKVMDLINGSHFSSALIPLGLVLGILAAANRIWLNKMRAKRNALQRGNLALATRLQKMAELSNEAFHEEWRNINRLSSAKKAKGFASASFNGIVDGMYLYVGILTLAKLSTAFLLPMAILCFTYALVCVVSRIYEEYSYQQTFKKTRLETELTLLCQRIETAYSELYKLRRKKGGHIDDTFQEKLREINERFKSYDAKRHKLKALSRDSYILAALRGVRHGLSAYGVVGSAFFVLGAVLVLSAVTFPPALLIAGILSGIVLLGGFITHSLVSNYRFHRQRRQKQAVQSSGHLYSHLDDLKKDIANQNITELESQDSFKQKLRQGMELDSSPQFFFQEWFEVIRSFFAGLRKGHKSVDFTLNALQEADDNGHYRDTPFMMGITVASSLLFSITLALKALGKVPKNDKSQSEKQKTEQPETSPKQCQQDQNQAPVKVSKNRCSFYSEKALSSKRNLDNNGPAVRPVIS